MDAADVDNTTAGHSLAPVSSGPIDLLQGCERLTSFCAVR